MSKIMAGNDGPVLGIYSSKDMFEKLKYESLRLQKDWRNPYDSFNFIVTAWHLFHDWQNCDEPLNSSRIKCQKNQLPSEMKLVLDVTKDIANGSKHFSLKKWASEKRRVNEVHTGNEVGYFQYFFHEDLPGVTVESHWYFNIRILHNLVMRYFEWVFDDSVPAHDFPSDLLEAILYCDIANRPSGRSPAVWLQHIESAYNSK